MRVVEGVLTRSGRSWGILAILWAILGAHASATNVSGTVQDSGGQLWFNGTWAVKLGTRPGFVPGPYFIAGTSTPVPNQVQNGDLDVTGAFSGVVLTPNASIAPAGSQWMFTVCPAATAQCFTQNFTAISGASEALTFTPPTISISLTNFLGRAAAYADAEVINGLPGNQYFNLTDQTPHVCVALPCSGANWQSLTPAPGGVLLKNPPASQTIVQPATTNLFVNRFEQFRFCDQFVSVQACVNDLPASGFGTNAGMGIIPFGLTWSPTATTLGTATSLLDLATDPRHPQIWGGSGDFEFGLNAGGNGSPSLALNDFLTTGASSRSAAIIFRSGGLTSATPGGLRNVWQIASGQGGANNDDLNMWGWQGSVYSTNTVTVANGSPTVLGAGTAWTTAMIGANFLDTTQSVAGTVYDVPNPTTLTLAENFTGVNQAGDSYTITGGSPGTQQSILIVGQNGVVLWNRRGMTSGSAAAANHVYYQFGMPLISTGSDTTMLFQRYASTLQNTVADWAFIDDTTNRAWGLDRLTNEFRIWPAFALGATPGTASLRLDNSGNMAIAAKLAVAQPAPTWAAAGYVDVQAADNSNAMLVHRTGGNVTHNLSLNGLGNGALAIYDNTGVGGGAKVNLLSDNKSVFSLGLEIGTGVDGNGSGFKHIRGIGGCATGAAAGDTCTTVVNWSTTFADANYTAQCGGRLVTSGVPLNGGITAQDAASVTFQTVAGTAAAAQYTNIDCIAVHD